MSAPRASQRQTSLFQTFAPLTFCAIRKSTSPYPAVKCAELRRLPSFDCAVIPGTHETRSGGNLSLTRREALLGCLGMLLAGVCDVFLKAEEPAVQEGVAEADAVGGLGEEVTERVYLEFGLRSGEDLGRVVVGIYGKRAPIAVGQFVSRMRDGSYKGTRIYRVVRGLTLQIGANGMAKRKEGEEVEWRGGHEGVGAVAMVDRRGESGRFLVEMRQGGSKYLEGRCVVIGRVEKGMDVLYGIEKMGSVGTQNRPRKEITVTDCGIV